VFSVTMAAPEATIKQGAVSDQMPTASRRPGRQALMKARCRGRH
jgi:hypothetical protein